MGCELGNLCWFYWLEIWLVGNWEKWKIHSVQVTLRANCMQCPHPCGFCINTRGPYKRTRASTKQNSSTNTKRGGTPVARVAGPRCLAGGPLLGCVPARLSPVVAMAPGDICHGPRCSPAGLRPVALEYRSCHWPSGSAGSLQCVRPLGRGLLHPVPLLPSVRVRARCPGPLGACSPGRAPCVFCLRCPWPLGACSPVHPLSAACACCWWLRWGPLRQLYRRLAGEILHTTGQPPELPPAGAGMLPYPRAHVEMPSQPGHPDRLAAMLSSQAPAGAA